MTDPDILAADFQRTVGRTPRLFRAPGRINLIGEHTDYNDGFVMPVALDRSTWVAAAPRSDRLVIARSDQVPGDAVIDLDDPRQGPTGHWSDYVAGVCAVLSRAAAISGADLMIRSDVPVGAGLSSSAALEVAVGFALLDLSRQPIDLTALALACQRAEHEVVGTRCGIMDQFIACHACEGAALLLDTRSLTADAHPLPPAVSVLACNTMVTHQLATAEYNARREDCEQGVRILARTNQRISALRDVTVEDLEAALDRLPERVFQRCRHVILENARVLEAGQALRLGHLGRVGRLMFASHESLRVDYEVSCRELDVMVDVAASIAGVYGARMTGGGFGGCAVVLVDRHAADDAAVQIRERYLAATGLAPEVWISTAGRGVTRWPV